MYSLLLAVIYLAFISLGLPDSLLGAGWPVMYAAFGVPISYMGIVSMVISAGTIVSSLASDAVTRRLKPQYVTLISVFLTAVALWGFSCSTRFWMLLVWAVPYGLGAGSVDAALNNYVALHYTSRHMSWLHCFWGVGTIVSPFVMSHALSTAVWNTGYRTIALLQIAIGLVLLLTLPLWRVNDAKAPAAATARPLGLAGALRIRGVPYLLVGFFAYCAAECTAMGWASTYLTQVRGVGETRAAAFASLIFIGLTVGRFLGGFLMDRVGDRQMIRLGTAVAVLGVLCVLLPVPGDTPALIGFVMIGLGYAPIYPCIIHSTPANFGAENSGAIIGIQMASAYVGATFMPPLYGLLGRLVGFALLPWYLLAFLVLMVTMTERTFRIAKG